MTSPLTAAEQHVLDQVDEDELVDLTSKLIAAASENPGGTEAAAVEVLRQACEDYGLQTEVAEAAPGRPNLVATLPGGSGPGAAPVIFLGHSDVVPAGAGWSRDPFTPVLKAGRLYGRGSTDMKGGLAAVVVAMGALARAGTELPAPVQLVCAVDEEEHGLGIRAFARQAAAVHNDVPTTAGADRSAGPGAYAACIVAEPTDLETVIGCRGDSYFELTVTGIAAHSGNPTDGRNAIDAASRVLELIRHDGERLATDPDPLLGHGTWNVGRIEGGHGTSIVAAGCTVSLDRRLMPDEDPEQLAAALRKQIGEAGIDTDGISVQLDVTMEMPGFRTSADSPVVSAAVEALADAGGGQSPVGGWTAACDGGFIARDFSVDTIVLGPGGLNDQAHQPDESVSVTEMTTAARVYALMCMRITSGQLE
ncbi:M20 family metallopeptidase [Arthrobacter castelli]|uniref:M20 family metallopeptidase n=1 Tax=Arthrobacter castelli TaxID=271431 RepID=UPI0003F61A5E|nr:M20 family metallopeptidase [Arthrobacter castelli]